MRSACHAALQATPGQLVFGRDMMLPIQHIADWQHTKDRKQKLINKNNERKNAAKRAHCDHKVGDKVLFCTPDPNKMELPREGPHPMPQAHTDGAVTLQKGAVSQSLHVRQIVPFQE